MAYFIAWCGFAGAWLLVAGPAFQAVLDFTDEDFGRDELDEARRRIDVRRVSPWWLLLPPVWYFLKHRQNREYRRTIMHSLTPERQEGMIRFSNVATGWLFVAGGALLLAIKETWEVTELYDWPVAAFVGMLVAALLACLGYLLYRAKWTQSLLEHKREPPSPDAPQT
jgi:hypothetical protein